jgi:phosphopantetheinyl transferase (holo-ACP synthase)
MSHQNDAIAIETEPDLVLREVWRAKDALSKARGHSMEHLFNELCKKEKCSGHPVVNLQDPMRPEKK